MTDFSNDEDDENDIVVTMNREKFALQEQMEFDRPNFEPRDYVLKKMPKVSKTLMELNTRFSSTEDWD